MFQRLFKIICFIGYVVVALFASCSSYPTDVKQTDVEVPVFPDYKGVLLPRNCAAPIFTVGDSLLLKSPFVEFISGNVVKTCHITNRGFSIDSKDWAYLVSASDTISVRVICKSNGDWIAYKPFNMFISEDTIDSYLVYRLIEPGYEVWDKMGIYQREISSYNEEEVITNKQTDGGCMNCHSFCNHSANTCLFHLRSEYSGTYVLQDDILRRLPQRHGEPNFVYPSWHPSARFITFSQNNTKQMFHTSDCNRIEVFDYASDIVVYDTKTDEVITSPLLHSSFSFETYPCWSYDGLRLYFSTADSVSIPQNYDKVRYSICSISFDPKTRTFGESVDTILNAFKDGKTFVFPRVSPDGCFLMFTEADYGNFSIWHKESRIGNVNLVTGERSYLPIRASYHSWSSNGRWCVCGSRCDDGLYTRPYIFHVDKNGVLSKPFILPQSDVTYYFRLMKSYNVLEFVKEKVNVDFDKKLAY